VWATLILFEDNKESEYGLLSKDSLLEMKKIENYIQTSEIDVGDGITLGWKDICLAESVESTACSPKSFISPITSAFTGMDIEVMNQDQIIESFKETMRNPVVWPMIEPLFDKSLSLDNLKVTYARTIMSIGAPLNINGVRYTDVSDRYVEQQKYATDVLVSQLKQLRADYGEDSIVKPDLVGQLPLWEEFETLLNNDASFAGFSVIFVFCFFIFHLKSFFLAFVGIMIILFSFPFTVLITEGVLRCTFFSSLHTLAIFIVLGIAADDVFVFVDAWR